MSGSVDTPGIEPPSGPPTVIPGWGVAIRMWWAVSWRASLVILGVDLLVTWLSGIFEGPLHPDKMGEVASSIASLPAILGCFWWVLSRGMQSHEFRVVVRRRGLGRPRASAANV